ncbi:hypothetical protein GUJ93_ZPchr0005g14994 [Zizania palustris]|uniref:Uncharacterized protein n=1 Tax=Zizania palustris TaxID=103762 RepID=A0A8J5S5P6_ZIZPA|nr:hypothetical protein GUJ93_ZPchr0005g14994 [Zizania palustris]
MSKRQRREYVREVGHIGTSSSAAAMPEWSHVPISFSVDDAAGIKFPHADPLVITADIAGTEVRRVLIDGGSSADIIFVQAFDQLCISKKHLLLAARPLQGFTGPPLDALGQIGLEITFGEGLLARTEEMPTQAGVLTVFGDQATARRAEYGHGPPLDPRQVNSVQGNPEDFSTPGESSKKSFPRPSPEGEIAMKVTVKDGKEYSFQLARTCLQKSLQSLEKVVEQNLDVFAWSDEDITGIFSRTPELLLQSSSLAVHLTDTPCHAVLGCRCLCGLSNASTQDYEACAEAVFLPWWTTVLRG